jgi:predicted Zn-dependent protease
MMSGVAGLRGRGGRKISRRARTRGRRGALVAGALPLLVGLLLPLGGCHSVSQIGAQLGQGVGLLDEEQATSLARTGEAFERSFADITPEQEYYIGRAVAATLLQRDPPLEDAAANDYLNLVGQTLAMASARPETFGGYHFQVVASDEINAFAAPGGLILVSRGLLRCCSTEDELAAVLAHEISHVAHKDGLRAIKRSRLTSALALLTLETARSLGSEDLQQLVEDFSGSIDDVSQTLVSRGYARKLEFQADAAAAEILRRVGYDPHALVTMLARMGERIDPHGPGFARTHPSPEARIRAVQGPARALPTGDAAPRRARFAAALGTI